MSWVRRVAEKRLDGQKFASGHIKFNILIRYTYGTKIKGLQKMPRRYVFSGIGSDQLY